MNLLRVTQPESHVYLFLHDGTVNADGEFCPVAEINFELQKSGPTFRQI